MNTWIMLMKDGRPSLIQHKPGCPLLHAKIAAGWQIARIYQSAEIEGAHAIGGSCCCKEIV